MHVAKRIALALLILPAAEFIVFLLMVAAIGFLKAALLMIATSALGVIILRQVGKPRIARFRSSLAQGETVELHASGNGFFTVLGGILLLLPGFITDVVGVLLLLPVVQQRIGAAILGAFRGTRDERHQVIDLPPEEWRRHPDRPLPKRKSPSVKR